VSVSMRASIVAPVAICLKHFSGTYRGHSLTGHLKHGRAVVGGSGVCETWNGMPPRRPWCARVELLEPTEGGVRVEG
jgi:hypothetical protein